MTTGIRPVADARHRTFEDPRVQAAWISLDCGFTAVADVFEPCCAEALLQLSDQDFTEYLMLAREIGRLGRGPDPLLAFLEEWPSISLAITGANQDLLKEVRQFINALHKSPNSKSILPFLQTLAAVSRRLHSEDQLVSYMEIAQDLMARTSGSIHGRQLTIPSPGLTHFFEQAPRLVSLLSIDGLRHWVDFGIANYSDHPEQQVDYFSLQSADARSVLHRERRGILFADVERSLTLYLRSLWQATDQLVPYATGLDMHHPVMPYFDALGMRVPDVFESASGVSGLDRYRALLAHMVGHRRWSMPQVADNWSPFQRLAVECFEDSRIDLLLIRQYPGLRRIFQKLHPKPKEDACNPDVQSCLRHRLTLMSYAVLDPDHGYQDPCLNEFVDRFHKLLATSHSSTAEMANLALSYVAKSRRQSDQSANVYFDGTLIDYRDDNRHLWQFIEESDDEEFFDDPSRRQAEDTELIGLPPRHYPEWDYKSQYFRPDWTSVYEALHPSANPAITDQLLQKHSGLAKKLKRLLDLIKPQDKVRIRYQEEGSELDLDIALRSLIDFRTGVTPDPRINMSHRTDGRDIDVLLLVDLSESLNQRVGGDVSAQTVLQLSQEAVALLAWSIDQLGDALAVAGFHSNTRHDVRYQHIKGFGEGWNDQVKSRIAAMQAGYSTRMGAALRHAGHYLGARKADKRILLVLTDGEPADIDVTDSAYLRADARKAVDTLQANGITTYCLSLDPNADEYVSEIFGKNWRVLDRIDRLPEQLPMLYLNLTR